MGTQLSLRIQKQLSGRNKIYGGLRKTMAVGFQAQRPRGEKAEPVKGAAGQSTGLEWWVWGAGNEATKLF